MNYRLPPLYKKLLLLSVVLGPFYWLVFTEDGQRRSDLVLLHFFGDGSELNLAIEKLNSGMTESRFQALFPDMELVCEDAANPFGDRICRAAVDVFSGVPAHAFTLFLIGDGLSAARLSYRRAYHETLRLDLTRRVGSPVPQSESTPVPIDGPLSWVVDDGLLLMPPGKPASDEDAALIWLSQIAMQRRRDAGADGR